MAHRLSRSTLDTEFYREHFSWDANSLHRYCGAGSAVSDDRRRDRCQSRYKKTKHVNAPNYDWGNDNPSRWHFRNTMADPKPQTPNPNINSAVYPRISSSSLANPSFSHRINAKLPIYFMLSAISTQQHSICAEDL